VPAGAIAAVASGGNGARQDRRGRLVAPAGTRVVALATFVEGPMMTGLAANEIVEAIRVPRLARHCRVGFSKICRKTGEFADAIGVAVRDPERGSLRLVAGATGGTPILIEDAGDPATPAQSEARRAFTSNLRARLHHLCRRLRGRPGAHHRGLRR
jgi:CO/xanthine dehydrogenase FAD-binding subunit